MKDVRIGPIMQRYMVGRNVDQPLLAAHLGLSPGDLYNLFLEDDVGILHLIRISEALGEDVLAYISRQVDLPQLMADGPGLLGFAIIGPQTPDQN